MMRGRTRTRTVMGRGCWLVLYLTGDKYKKRLEEGKEEEANGFLCERIVNAEL